MSTQTITASTLEERITALEKSSWGIITAASAANNGSSPSPSPSPSSTDAYAYNAPIITPELRRARRHVQRTECCHSSVWKHCPSDYYALSLDERRKFLGAHSTSQLCKACLFENKNYEPNDNNENDDDDDDDKDKASASSKTATDPTNSRYYLVVVQYTQTIDTKKLSSELRGLRPPGPTRFGPNYFSELRLAPERVSEELTGYGHNGVSPFGLDDSTIPVIVCKSIVVVDDGDNVNAALTAPRFVWMGGGDKDWKLGMATSEFVRGVDGIVLDASVPRT